MISYAKVVEQTIQPPKGACVRKPTFRASAIFPATHSPGMTTRLSFLGYWMIKRRIPDVTAVITVRSSDGRMVSRSVRLIDKRQAYRVELAEELAKGGFPGNADFVGSIEIEFFSSRDLVFAYPAVVVNYYSPNFSSFVHTAQRIFNDAEDAGEVLETSVPESGFNIYADGDAAPFFTFINGCEGVPDCVVNMTFFNKRGETLEHVLPVGALRPYQVTTVRPEEAIDLKNFLKGDVGTIAARFNVRWVFPRIIAGNRQQSLDALSITHTFYDCAKTITPDDYWSDAPEDVHPAALMVPLLFDERHEVNIYFYPIISPSTINIDVEVYAADGTLLGTIQDALRIESPHSQLHSIPLTSICERLGASKGREYSAKVIARPSAGSRLPSRIKMGVDVGVSRQQLPCNICISLEPFNLATEKKKGAFRWAPLFADQPNASAWLLNGSAAKKYERPANVDVTFYRESDEKTLQRKLVVAPHGVQRVEVDNDPELVEFFEKKPGWFVAISDNPYLTSFYFVEHPSGIVGGDHGF